MGVGARVAAHVLRAPVGSGVRGAAKWDIAEGGRCGRGVHAMNIPDVCRPLTSSTDPPGKIGYGCKTNGTKNQGRRPMSDQNRRRLLKAVAAATGAAATSKLLPENWTKPVLDAIVLPAHAQATTVSPAMFFATGSGAIGSLQRFQVPGGVTSITIEAWGAGGGSLSGAAGGRGARMRGTFSVSPGDVLAILVGQQGGSGPGRSASGGGGTFVADGSNNPLIVAGGGGGAWIDASSTPAVAGGDGQTGTSGGGDVGGSGGNGGAAPSGAGGGSGGGFYTNGADGAYGYGGAAFLNGGQGGTGGNGSVGGFGGGGNNSNNGDNVGGGGGGYSGGGGSGNGQGTATGGGGSYNAGSSQSNSGGVQAGDGQVVITW